MTWVFAGDSITHGCFHTHGARNYVEHCTESLHHQDGRIADIVINAGVSGWRVPDLLADLDFRLVRFTPDVVVLMLGTNDAISGESGVRDFASDLESLVLRIRASGAFLVLQREVRSAQDLLARKIHDNAMNNGCKVLSLKCLKTKTSTLTTPIYEL